MNYQIHIGDALQELKKMPDQSIQCWVTSPPYWGLRDYGVDGQLGLEKTPEEYVSKMVGIFREARRVLMDDGTLWLNMGDGWAGGGRAGSGGIQKWGGIESKNKDRKYGRPTGKLNGIKKKDIIGIPWMLAFALRDDGWYLRQDIIWHKPNPMPESVRDRCTKSHEYLFLLSKSGEKILWRNKKTREWSYTKPNLKEWYFDPIDKKRKPLWQGYDYYFDQDAIKEPAAYLQPNSPGSIKSPYGQGFTRRAKGNSKTFRGGGTYTMSASFSNSSPKERASHGNIENESGRRNKRSVWEIATKPFPQAHFATFPPALVEPCILAGCPEGGVVGDMFTGAGTTGAVALKHFRRFIGIELNPQYVNEIAIPRIEAEASRHKQIPIFEGNQI